MTPPTAETAAPLTAASHTGPLQALSVRDFRLLWLGKSVSLLGDQLYLVALPWLTWQLTGSGLALGTVLMAEALPRMLLMLAGGVLADRWSPRRVMLVTNAIRAALASVLAVLTFAHALWLPLLYAFAFAFGIADAFFQPAMLAFMPRTLDEERLHAGNALLQATAQLSTIVGPALAGIVIALGATWMAIAADAATFVFTAILLARIPDRPHTDTVPSSPPGRLLDEMIAGLRLLWTDPQMRLFMLLIMAIDLLLAGPTTTGIPILAQRFGDGVGPFSAMLMASGIGALAGSLLAGAWHPGARLGEALLSLAALIGAATAALGWASTLTPALALVATIGGAVSFVNIHIISWLQRRAPPAFIGRVMSVVMLAALGLDPLSRALAGLAADWSLTWLYLGAGSLLVLLALGALCTRAARAIG